MPLWRVSIGIKTFESVVWVDGIQGDVYVYCDNTGLFHPHASMTSNYYTGVGPYQFGAIGPGYAGILIQNNCGRLALDHSMLPIYAANPENLTVRNVMLTVAGEHGRV